MTIKIFTIFILSFLTRCAQISREHTQNNLVALKENSDTFRNHSSEVDTTNGLIIPTGKMQTARATHTATLLKSSKVLIAGGFAGSSSLSSAEIYDPALKTFASVGQMSVARSAHTATLLPNGQVLIAGGYNGSYLSSTEIYDPQAQTFSVGPVMNTPRSGHTATVLNNGKILFAGGVGIGWSFLQSAELYNIQTKTFTLTSSMTTARESHTATLLKNGSVLIIGGHKDRRAKIKIYSSAELYDPVLSSFKPAGNMNITRYKPNGTSILLPNGNVLIAGGANRAEIYQPASGKFSIVFGSMGTKRLFSCATLLQKEQVLVTGGYNENQEPSAGAWLYIYKK